MVTGLLAPVVGPAVDHHYADRSPVHAHAFTGDATNEHVHENVLENHDHSSGPVSDGVSVVSTSFSSAHGPITIDGATLELFTPNLQTHFMALFMGELPPPDSASIAPLDRPPRLG